MNNNKKTSIILIIVAIVVIAIAFAFMYFATDLFKSNKQLFAKYMGTVDIQTPEYITNKITEEYNKTNSKSNSTNTNIKVLSTKNNNQEVFKITSNGLKNTTNNQGYKDFTLSSNNQEIATVKYLRDNNTYALTAKNILSKYVSVENTNINEFLQKLGVEADNIPGTLPFSALSSVGTDTQAVKQFLSSYIAVAYENIPDNKFQKTSSNQGEKIYSISLTEQEFAKVIEIVLNNMKNDELLSEYIKNEASKFGYTISSTQVSAKIDELLESLNNKTFSNESEFLNVAVTVSNKQAMKVALSFNNFEEQQNYIITADVSNNNAVIITAIENNEQVLSSTVQYSYNNSTISIEENIRSQEKEFNIKYVLNNYSTDSVTMQLELTDVTDEYVINLDKQIDYKEDIQIEKLTTDNAVKINDYSEEDLEKLTEAIINRIIFVYGEQLSQIAVSAFIPNTNNSNNNNSSNNISYSEYQNINKIQ